MLVIISIIGIIFAFFLFIKEGYVININPKNKELVSTSLNEEIENVNNVTKIILGQGWHAGELTEGKKETLYITEGMFNLGELEKYVKEYGLI